MASPFTSPVCTFPVAANTSLTFDALSFTDKIGQVEATAEYTNRLLPILQAHPEVFPSAKFESCFSLEWFHIQGSRILSRSFGVEGVKGTSLAVVAPTFFSQTYC